jgi:hypothetical protein
MVGRTVIFLLAWALLDVVLNLRFPASEPIAMCAAPSPDTVLLLAALAFLGYRGRTLARSARFTLVAWFLFARAFRIADGIEARYLGRTFNLYIELPLVPEILRLLRATVPAWKLAALTAGLIVGLGATAALVSWALCAEARYLAEREGRRALASTVALFAVVSLLSPKSNEHRTGTFAASFCMRLVGEADFLLHVAGHRSAKLEEIRRVQARLGETPHDLGSLRGADVYLFVVESYGQTLLDRPVFAEPMRSLYADFERELSERGFSMASAVLSSPTYGGSSWLAHATIATGVRTEDQFRYELLIATKPKTIAQFFRSAGYRTVSVQPGTTRPWPQGEYQLFDERYGAWTLDYHGPSYKWATMPDQYAIDFVRRREFNHRSQPLFVEYALVSSHAPWSDQPALVDDWSSLGDGSVYLRLRNHHYDVSWSDLGAGKEAYLRSIQYDMEVLKRYVATFVQSPSLVIIIGDHQPAADVTDHSPARGVPIHVMSREVSFVDRFVSRGYSRGMQPSRVGTPAGMETLLPALLEDFSSATPTPGR